MHHRKGHFSRELPILIAEKMPWTCRKVAFIWQKKLQSERARVQKDLPLFCSLITGFRVLSFCFSMAAFFQLLQMTSLPKLFASTKTFSLPSKPAKPDFGLIPSYLANTKPLKVGQCSRNVLWKKSNFMNLIFWNSREQNHRGRKLANGFANVNLDISRQILANISLTQAWERGYPTRQSRLYFIRLVSPHLTFN